MNGEKRGGGGLQGKNKEGWTRGDKGGTMYNLKSYCLTLHVRPWKDMNFKGG